MHRRSLLQAGVMATTTASSFAQDDKQAHQPDIKSVADKQRAPTFVATWKFGQAACERSLEALRQRGSLRDAVELGINVTELDESNRSVGYGGLPNAKGKVQLDACFMDGASNQAGAVAALEGYPNPVSVARRVMESTRHVMLAGADAAQFAAANGFQKRKLLTPGAEQAWREWLAKQEKENKPTTPPDSHDTIALLGLGNDGQLVGGCSTSGLAFKLPGRVGDSPIIGSGLYVDGQVGAAGATGVGENIMRYCGSFLIVEFMRQGMTPNDACQATIQRIAQGEGKPPTDLSVNFVAVNKDGVVGAAGTDAGFRCAIVDDQHSLVARPIIVS